MSDKQQERSTTREAAAVVVAMKKLGYSKGTVYPAVRISVKSIWGCPHGSEEAVLTNADCLRKICKKL